MPLNGLTRRTVLWTGLTAPLLSCAPGRHELSDLVEGEAGRVVRVRDGDALVLDTGLNVRLAEIEAPRRGWKKRVEDPFGEQSAHMLEELALGRRAALFYGGLTRDKYERAIAHLRVWDETGEAFWLNAKVVQGGGARVRTWPDNCAKVRELYGLEADARREQRGLWAHSEYDVLAPDDLKQAPKGVHLVEGEVHRISEVSKADSYCSPNQEGGFNLSLGYRLARSAERMELALSDIIRVRGWHGAYKDRSASIKLNHWGQVEHIGPQ